MKTKMQIKYMLLLIILLTGSCSESRKHTVTTRILHDGSCVREFKTRFTQIPDYSEYPIKIDSGWKSEIVYDTIGEKQDTFLLFSKTFKKVKELNLDYSDSLNNFAIIGREVKLKKKFRWFYTNFEYHESYGKMLDGEPLSAYVDEKDMWALGDEANDSLVMASGLDSNQLKIYTDSIVTQYFMWITKTNFNNFYKALLHETQSREVLRKYNSKLEAMHDSLQNAFIESENDLTWFIKHTDSLFGAHGKLLVLLDDSTSSLAKVNQRIDFFSNIWFNYHLTHELILPGLITQTNADSVKNNTLYFSVEADRFFTTDYVMTGVSRVKNTWAYYVSGFLVLLALTAFAAGKVRNKKAKGQA